MARHCSRDRRRHDGEPGGRRSPVDGVRRLGLDLGDPRPAVELAHDPRRHHQLTGGGRVERQRADGERAGTRKAQRVVGLDRGERLRRLRRARVAPRRPTRRCGSCGAATRTRRRRPAREVVAGVELAGDRTEAGGRGRGGHARVRRQHEDGSAGERVVPRVGEPGFAERVGEHRTVWGGTRWTSGGTSTRRRRGRARGRAAAPRRGTRSCSRPASAGSSAPWRRGRRSGRPGAGRARPR